MAWGRWELVATFFHLPDAHTLLTYETLEKQPIYLEKNHARQLF